MMANLALAPKTTGTGIGAMTIKLLYTSRHPTFEGLSVSGSGDIIAQTKITSGNLKLNVSGSGSLQAEIDAADVDADVSGSGDMDPERKV
jgi:hypothetical protein